MKMMTHNTHKSDNMKRWMTSLSFTIALLMCGTSPSAAQITIGGNVYGGGNEAKVEGSTTVTVRSLDLNGSVFGGARMADVGGWAFVNIDGANMSGDITINRVYGGNDISGIVGSSNDLPDELTNTEKYHIDNTYNAFILTTKEKTAEEGETQHHIFVGQMFGGGNGDYTYTTTANADGNYTASDADGNIVATSTTLLQAPEAGKTYQEIRGGTFGYVYAGGNNATVTEAADICIDNSSTPMESNAQLQLPASVDLTDINNELNDPNNQRLMDMGINITTFKRGYNFQRVFGGNNKADMHIAPTWHLEKGSIGSLYSGGNEGNMTSPRGLLLEIGSRDAQGNVIPSEIEVVNVFGGCRKAHVIPLTDEGEEMNMVLTPEGYNFPSNLAARVLIRSGKITNVYGGNDITGDVWGGTAVGIYTSISGDVYGGGNGSYAYTDTPEFANDLLSGDFYYNPAQILGETIPDDDNGLASARALNKFRPNAEQVSIRVWGPDANHPTKIRSIYLGGNSATLKEGQKGSMVELKIGSNVIAENVFLGNNGENMVNATEGGILWQYAQKGLHYQVGDSQSTETVAYSTMDLTKPDVFAEYMNGCAMNMVPSVVFDDENRKPTPDPDTYSPYSSYFGSLFCGGNVGSMTNNGLEAIDFKHEIIVFDKVVGGCNNANVAATTYNAAYEGGIIGNHDSNGDKLQLNFEGLKIQPKRWADADKTALVWNTIDASHDNAETDPITTGELSTPAESTDDDLNRRLKGGNIYGGCYNSGHVNGNVVINLNASIVDRNILFDEVETDNETGEAKLYGKDSYKITKRNTGVILDQQGMDPLGKALNVFGGGYGPESEVWGSTTINLKRGYTFQIFGGGEQGVIGKPDANGDYEFTYEKDGQTVTKKYKYDPKYSCTINLCGNVSGVSRHANNTEDMAEAEFIYGGGFFGPIAGDTRVNLGNGRIFNSFAGSCNADILGHTETFMGLNSNNQNNQGFPYVRDHIYGGNDLGGSILGSAEFNSRISSDDAKAMVYNAKNTIASAYIEYQQGRVEDIFGGCYGDYDYAAPHYKDYTYTTGETGIPSGKTAGMARPGFTKPRLDNAFVNFRPVASNNALNRANNIYGAGQGHSMDSDRDIMQQRSYILIDIQPSMESFYTDMNVFGAGKYSGLGMGIDSETAKANADKVTAAATIDLMHGQIAATYGASYQEGITRRTIVNVPQGSTIRMKRIFGGAYGVTNDRPCDVYEAHVNYSSADAIVGGYRDGIYGGNNNCRRTFYSFVNLNVPVWYDKTNGYLASVFGAGYGADTWAQYTQVNMNSGAQLYEVYGGGNAGMVLNKQSAEKYATADGHNYDLTIGNGYTDEGLDCYLVEENELGEKSNTNVNINEGANVSGYIYNGNLSGAYAYGAGYGRTATVAGSTYVGLHGGTVAKDIYAGGSNGAVEDKFELALDNDPDNDFTATATAYIKGGTARNVYGSGWRGSVGHHNGKIWETPEAAHDINGVTKVIIGNKSGNTLYNGIPVISRNVYGGGEGGAVYGTANVTVNNGYIGYRFVGHDPTHLKEQDFEEELNDKKVNDIDKAGNVFGGGYVAGTYTDNANVTMYNGTVRGSLYGGGEVGYIGRGTVKESWPGDITNGNAKIYKGGQTHVTMYGGHVKRDIFGGGRGYDNWGGEGKDFMSEEELATADFDSKGFVFGATDVIIHGGEVGTEEGALLGYGNVFGGGNEGFVYSATGKKVGQKESDENMTNGMPTSGGGYYYELETLGSDGKPTTGSVLTSDCLVDVAPYCRVINTEGFSKEYPFGTYVPTEELNKLKNKNSDADKWAKLDVTGITIHNAIFAGGNITEGSDKLNANTITVYGNAAASLRDVYNRDLVSLGTDNIGGLYGDGNLTLVDGFRELHIDNYGTDKYSLADELEIADYEQLSPREKAYYQLKYVTDLLHTYSYYESKRQHTYEHTTETGEEVETPYKKGQKITEEEYNAMSEDEKKEWTRGTKSYQQKDEIEEAEYILMDEAEQRNWKLLGVCSIYAGRPLNTIQRADMCGVFGSRLVLNGTQDRVPENVDYSDYTINRVDEVSLNKRTSQAGDNDEVNKVHGNYFGIYNSVNYLGNLTSDVFFTETASEGTDAIRKTNSSNDSDKTSTEYNGSTTVYGETTYYQWKAARPQAKNRNNGTSHNKVALASGVYLEIKREESETTGTDDWGFITGVVELDLINVMPGMGGGYVYARNEHGVKTWHGVGTSNPWGKVTMLDYNKDARTYRRFEYTKPNDTDNLKPIETSGNFVHNVKQIVDDCFPNGGRYTDGYVESPAHYWFIKGSIYVYDQYISAYTGAANAYAEKVEMPLTISAASNGRMTLRDVQPNYYAYYDKNGNKLGDKDSNADETFKTTTKTYALNDPITYWDYQLLSEADKERFVEETYTTIAECTIGETHYPKGYTLLPDEYLELKNGAPKKKLNDTDSQPVPTVYLAEEERDVDFDFVFRPSNNLSHDKGYILTHDVNNPSVWNDYYTLIANAAQEYRVQAEGYEGATNKNDYVESPTYTSKVTGVYGQQAYKQGAIVSSKTVNDYEANIKPNLNESQKGKQAEMEPAYVVTADMVVTATGVDNGDTEVARLKPGTPIAESIYNEQQWAAILASQKVEPAKVCTKLLKFNTTDYVYAGKVLSSADIDKLKAKVREANSEWTDAQVNAYLSGYYSDANYCKKEGLYGGLSFTNGKAYRALDTWCAMSKEERANFDFNYDAFDVLIDPSYGADYEPGQGGDYGYKPQYDGTLTTPIYSEPQRIDYKAEYMGKQAITFTQKKEDGTTEVRTINPSSTPEDWLSRDDYERIPNEKHHYSPVAVTAPGNYYVVTTAFMRSDVPYTIGQTVDESTYNALPEVQKNNVAVLNFTEQQTKKENGAYVTKYYYYCREDYKVDEKGEGVAVTDLQNNEYGKEQTVPKGTLISQESYDNLKNFQAGFAIHGTSPTLVNTLYVSNESDIYDLSKEKIITVIYLYEYEESDESGMNIVPVSERHIVNIHVNFKSGVPQISKIDKPDTVLPGTAIGMETPTITQGAYQVTDSGWELFTNWRDYEAHNNGEPYSNNTTPLYWYQNNYWLAYYAETYLGKTYSNAVQVSVANSHDLKRVMKDKEHHYYIDHSDVDYEPKIYINDYKTDDPATSQNGLDLLKDLMDLTHGKTVDGHAPLTLDNPNKPIKNAKFLEFFLRADQDHASSEWTPIANGENECFSGVLHGDGHTISGLDHSLFDKLCGDVYNLGVTGSFTGAGIAETGEGYVENCWVASTAAGGVDTNTKAVFGNPAEDGGTHVVNSYYPESNTYANGPAKAMPQSAFYNGTVAYNLNNFYLNKRFYDNSTISGQTTSYYFLPVGTTDGTLPEAMSNGTYPKKPDVKHGNVGYVESRFADGDFRYAANSIPDVADIRQRTVKDSHQQDIIVYAPIWPDDYLFFGQTLTYGYNTLRPHDSHPVNISKDGGRLVQGETSNRVYRAPVYRRSNVKEAAHFNPWAYIVAHSKSYGLEGEVLQDVYPNITAVDFHGHDDLRSPSNNFSQGWTLPVSQAEGSAPSLFYPPLLDDGGLVGIARDGQTPNMLVYAPSAQENVKTYDVLNNAFSQEPLFDDYHEAGEYYEGESEDNSRYNRVAVAPASAVLGHLVQHDLTATNDHLLVDKQDFYAPFAYSFDDSHRIWHQRTPDNFVGQATGWEGISLPFTATLVSTQDKGELTHFYEGSQKGHEYWLRQYRELSVEGQEAKAGLYYPLAANNEKDYTNTFLWDYYYSKDDYRDWNDDRYQQQYYSSDYLSTLYPVSNYPYALAATPYIVGFPGSRYYEFDLSGTWTPEHRVGNETIASPGKQTVTFASEKGFTINASYDDLKEGDTHNGYSFMPSYLNFSGTQLPSNSYVLNASGSAYEVGGGASAEMQSLAFRPFFAKVSDGSRPVTRITFSNAISSPGDDDCHRPAAAESLTISAKRQKIVVTSNLLAPADVSIVTPAGITLTTFAIAPGETIETRIANAGVYIVQTADRRYTKKLAVR